MSKIAITSEGPSLDDRVDPRFGRAAGFVVVDLETMAPQYIDNGQSQVMSQGAGIQAAELVARAGVSHLLTGFVGPKAFQALTAAGIKVGQNLDGLTVRQAVERFKSGQVEIAQAANRSGR
jgi:predicted Fe-Mo cluster-binding NifX family protein